MSRGYLQGLPRIHLGVRDPPLPHRLRSGGGEDSISLQRCVAGPSRAVSWQREQGEAMTQRRRRRALRGWCWPCVVASVASRRAHSREQTWPCGQTLRPYPPQSSCGFRVLRRFRGGAGRGFRVRPRAPIARGPVLVVLILDLPEFARNRRFSSHMRSNSEFSAQIVRCFCGSCLCCMFVLRFRACLGARCFPQWER